MVRVKRGILKHKKRERLLKQTKGFRWRRKSTKKAAKEAIIHAMHHAFRGRKEKKRVFRANFQIAIGAAARAHGLSYSRFMGALKQKNVKLDRKILADLAERDPSSFTKIVEAVKS